tara:strand:+ start:779 stop:1384 length:606 start_codon:yes stop_codon:yes gene_type:complete
MNKLKHFAKFLCAVIACIQLNQSAFAQENGSQDPASQGLILQIFENIVNNMRNEVPEVYDTFVEQYFGFSAGEGDKLVSALSSTVKAVEESRHVRLQGMCNSNSLTKVRDGNSTGRILANLEEFENETNLEFEAYFESFVSNELGTDAVGNIEKWADEFIKPNVVQFDGSSRQAPGSSSIGQALKISAEDMDLRIDRLCDL